MKTFNALVKERQCHPYLNITTSPSINNKGQAENQSKDQLVLPA